MNAFLCLLFALIAETEERVAISGLDTHEDSLRFAAAVRQPAGAFGRILRPNDHV